jgi:hypothetical protein
MSPARKATQRALPLDDTSVTVMLRFALRRSASSCCHARDLTSLALVEGFGAAFFSAAGAHHLVQAPAPSAPRTDAADPAP